MLTHRLHALLHLSKTLTFVLMMVFATVFSLSSLNLFSLLRANINLFLDHGLMVIADGALRQLGGLLLSGATSTAAYVMFKACEHVLVDAIAAKPLPAAALKSPTAAPAAGGRRR